MLIYLCLFGPIPKKPFAAVFGVVEITKKLEVLSAPAGFDEEEEEEEETPGGEG